MNWNIFWGTYILVFAIIMFCVWYFIDFKKTVLKKKCTDKTNGKIIKYSRIAYNKINLPVVEYIVNGVTYKTVGPKFKGTITKCFSASFAKSSSVETNLTTRENLPDVLKIHIKNSSYIENPLLSLYPIGSDVEVYYNPNKPRMSYVQRVVKPYWLLKILLFLSIVLLIFSLYLFFGPTIVMK